MYSKEDLLRLRADTLKVDRKTRKKLFAYGIWKPRRHFHNKLSGVGESWSFACTSTSVPVDHWNPQNSVYSNKKPKLLCPKRKLSIGTWNVRTVKDDSQLHILANELGKWNCDIVGVAETQSQHRRAIHKWLQVHSSRS